MKFPRLLTSIVSAATLLGIGAPQTVAQIASSSVPTTTYQSARVPVQQPTRSLSATRQTEGRHLSKSGLVSANANPWILQATLPSAVIHDLSFPTPQVGFAAAELGQVWKTSDGGSHWTEIMNLGFPYYWYGVKALNTNDVVISGFNNSNFQGIVRWSHDGGTTWSDDIVVNTQGWANRVRFASPQDGLVTDLLNLTAPNAAHYTTDGGHDGADWTQVVPDPNGGWFGNQFSFLPSLHARMSGISYCDSLDGGADWSCKAPVDSVFDGPVFFQDEDNGWVGGGTISPSVEGWVHRTTDGGQTWSDRTLDVTAPIREIYFISPKVGWAVGGNIYSGDGVIYFSRDGGQTWSLDMDTNGHEMDACATPTIASSSVQIWCAGYDSSFNGVIYKLDRLSQ